MFIKKDLRKIPTILSDAVDCRTYDEGNDENSNNGTKIKRTKREEPLRILKLGRRKQEFNGCVRVLCQPEHFPKLGHLSVVNLYECDIHDLTGFGPVFGASAPNLETLNLGRNPLSKGIPDDFSEVKSLKHLWLDDCKLAGALPRALLKLPNLESLRLPNNRITHLDIGEADMTNGSGSNIGNSGKNRDDGEEFEYEWDDTAMKDASTTTNEVTPLKNLKILCLDRNLLGTTDADGSRDGAGEGGDTGNANPNTSKDAGDDPREAEQSGTSPARAVLPPNLAEWFPALEELLLRHNHVRRLGVRDWPEHLRILHLSSNRLESLSELSSGGLRSLAHLSANGNLLGALPEGILSDHPGLRRLVVSHNPPLRDLPVEVWERMGLLPRAAAGAVDEAPLPPCDIVWQPNPNLSAPAAGGGREDGAMEE